MPAHTAIAPCSRESAGLALRDGRLVILPTDTLWGVFASARSPQAIGQLTALRAHPATGPRTWHAPSAQALLETIPLEHPTHRHIVANLTPGGVRFVIECGQEAVNIALTKLGIPSGIIDDAGVLAVRVPDHGACADVLTRAGVPAIAERLDALTPGAEASVAAMLDEAPKPLGKASTTVRLTRNGSYRVEQVGAVDEASIRRRVESLIVFLCTGNTCRSPMAEAIARDVLAKSELQTPVRVASAGVAAEADAPMTPEARFALEALGIDPGRHRARAITLEALRDAKVVYAMTRSHAARALSMLPDANVILLDPNGQDIQDPIGGSAAQYAACARQLQELIKLRLKDWSSKTVANQ